MSQRSSTLSVAAVLGASVLTAMLTLGNAPAEASSIAWPAQVFAPYVDTGLSNTTLTTVAADYGTKFFTLAFVDGTGCTWSMPNEASWHSQLASLHAEGGDATASFGGYTTDTNGTDLGATCSSASAMATQVESVVPTVGVKHLDFDIESNELTNSADLTRTAQALNLVRQWGTSTSRPLTISYTIPVLPSGLTSTGKSVLSIAKAQGFTPDIINIMSMDYGTSGTEMGTAADQALDATATQVASVFGISTSAAFAKLGNTPMIGQNDSAGEIFTLADANTVKLHAEAEGIKLVSVWAEGRDNGGCPGQTSASSTCSGVSQNSGAYTETFQPFTK